MGIEEKLPSGVLLTSVEKLAGWARARSVWPATFGLACCAIEMMQTGGPRHDMARFGMEKTGSTPREVISKLVSSEWPSRWLLGGRSTSAAFALFVKAWIDRQRRRAR